MTLAEKALEVVKEAHETALAEWNTGEWESDGTEDIAPSFPVIKLVQPTSSMPGAEKHVGEFYRSDDEAYYGTLDLVPLFKKDTRALFVTGNDQPVCASNDGIAPRLDMPLWRTPMPEGVPELWLEAMNSVEGQPASCDGCPFSQWDGDNPPPCKSSINVLVHHEGSLAQLRISGKSIKPFKQFVARKLAPKKLPLCSQRLHLYTEIRTEPGKKWAELRIDNTLLTPTEAKPYNAVLRDERARFESSLAIEPDDEAAGQHGAPEASWPDGSKSFAQRITVDQETGEVLEGVRG